MLNRSAAIKKLSNLICEDRVLYEIVFWLWINGYEVSLVGGIVRDTIMGVPSKDVDIVTNAEPDEIAEIFSNEKVEYRGANFLVVVVNGYEIATYRKDIHNTGLASECVVEKAETLEDDLGRRDFTINSVAFKTGDPPYLIDPYSGINDMCLGVIKFVGNPDKRIKEGYERIIRACRFCIKIGRVNFEPYTLDALKRNVQLVKLLPPEKILLEIKKAMECEKASLFFRALYKIGALNYIFPSLVKCYFQDGGPHHAETIFEHCMEVGDSISTKNWKLKLAGYLHDVGKPLCAKIAAETMALRFKKHPEKGAELVYSELKILKFSNKDIEYITSLIRLHMASFKENLSKKAVKRFLVKLEESNIDYRDWMRIFIADRKGNYKHRNFTFYEIRNKLKGIHTLYREEKMFSFKDLVLNGRDVVEITGYSPGPVIGKILKELFEDCLNNSEHNTREYLTNKLLNMGKLNYA